MNRYEAKEFVDRVHRLADAWANREVSFDPDAGHAAFLREAGIDLDALEGRDHDDGKRRLYLSDRQHAQLSVFLAHLEEEIAGGLDALLGDFAIVRNDGAGPSENPKDVAFNTANRVASIEVRETPKVYEWPDGKLEKIAVREYIAHGAAYKTATKEAATDETKSGPEGFVKVHGETRPILAASALAARLLEAKAAGVV